MKGHALDGSRSSFLGMTVARRSREDPGDAEYVVDKDKPACKEMYRLSLFSGQIRSANAK